MLNKVNFLDRLKDIYEGEIIALDEYINARSSIRFYCKRKDVNGEEHGEFKKTPYELITLKRPCPKCLGSVKPNGFWNDLEHCLTEAKKYRNKFELQRKCYGCYNGFIKNGWLDEFFVSKKKPNGYWSVLENVQKEAVKYKNAKEFSLKGGGAYNAAQKYGFLNKIKYNER